MARKPIPNSFQRGFAPAARALNKPVASQPPAGFYDPSLDAAKRAGDRGLQQLTEDIATQNQRALQQYQLQTQAGQTQSARSLADLLSQHTRFGQDAATQSQREGQDFQTQLANVARQFQRLGQSQAQSASARGLGAGALSAAMKARTANQALADQPIQTAHERNVADLAQSVAREGQDYATQTARANEDLSTGLASLGMDYGYGVADRGTQLTRAQLENTAYGQDIGAQKLYQAGQAGWTMPNTTGWDTLSALLKRKR